MLVALSKERGREQERMRNTFCGLLEPDDHKFRIDTSLSRKIF